MPVQVLESNKARIKWRDLLDMANAGGSDVVIERYGRPVVAVISYEDYVALKDELEEIRATRRAAQAYEKWKQDPTSGRPWEEIEAELVTEGLLDE